MEVTNEQITLLSTIAAAILEKALKDNPLSFPCVSFKFCLLDTCVVKLEWFDKDGHIKFFVDAYKTSILPSYKPEGVAESFVDRAFFRAYRITKKLAEQEANA